MTRERDLEVCDFVREILAARTGTAIRVTAEPDIECRDIAAVEQLWESDGFLYAAEHTRIEPFHGQIRNEATVIRLLTPIRVALTGVIPGNFRLIVHEKDTRQLPRSRYSAVRMELAKLITQIAPSMAIGQLATIESPRLPFTAHLRRRSGPTRQLLIESLVDLDPDAGRSDRINSALAKKLPKLAYWSQDDRQSVLILESADIEHSNMALTLDALRSAVEHRLDAPDIVVLVETDSSPWSGWILKERMAWGDEVPRTNGVGFYIRGDVAGLPRY